MTKTGEINLERVEVEKMNEIFEKLKFEGGKLINEQGEEIKQFKLKAKTFLKIENNKIIVKNNKKTYLKEQIFQTNKDITYIVVNLIILICKKTNKDIAENLGITQENLKLIASQGYFVFDKDSKVSDALLNSISNLSDEEQGKILAQIKDKKFTGKDFIDYFPNLTLEEIKEIGNNIKPKDVETLEENKETDNNIKPEDVEKIKNIIKNLNNYANISFLDNLLNEWDKIEKIEKKQKTMTTEQEKEFDDKREASGKTKKEGRERLYDELFRKYEFILSQIFAPNYFYTDDFKYLGGKGQNGKGSCQPDFVFLNPLTLSIAIIEIKNDETNIVDTAAYRGNNDNENNVFTMSKELTGGMVQVLNYKKVWRESGLNELPESYKDELNKLSNNEISKIDSDLSLNQEQKYQKLTTILNKKHKLSTANCKCVLIIGQTNGLTEAQIKSFELYREAVKDVEIITFDELKSRIQSLKELFEKNNSN